MTKKIYYQKGLVKTSMQSQILSDEKDLLSEGISQNINAITDFNRLAKEIIHAIPFQIP